MRRFLRVVVLFSPLLAFCFSLIFGERVADPAILYRFFFGTLLPEDSVTLNLVISIRLPLTIQAFLCGGLLAVAGGAMQAVLRNPLAEPYILGVSSGSAFGLVAAALLGVGGYFWIQFGAAFVGGLLAVAIVLGGAVRRKQPLNMVRLILLGVAVNAFFSALTMLMQSFLDPYQFTASVGLLMGEVSLQGPVAIGIAAFVGIPAVLFIWCRAPELDILTQGRDQAMSIGLAVDREMVWALVAATFASAIAVSMCGIIGFVGLAAPHVVRALWGGRHKWLLPVSFLIGGTFLVTAHLLSRILAPASGLPLTPVTALVGAPLFFWIIRNVGARHA